MRRDLRRDADAVLLGLAHELDRTARADVGDVDACTGILGEQDVARDGDVLGDRRTALHAEHRAAVALIHDAVLDERRLFLVVDDDLVERVQVIVSVQEHLGRRVEVAVIGERDGTGLDHVAELCELLALLPLRDRTNDADVDLRDILRALLEAAHQSGRVDDRLRVRHRRDRRVAAGCRCLRAGLEVLFGLLAWLAEMRVHVDEARRDDLAGCIVDFCTFCRKILADGCNLAILDQHISDFVKMLCRIDDPATFEYQFHSCLPPVRTKVKSAMRTATPFWTSS